MANKDKPTFTIVGAGLSGALMAGYLGQAGYKVDMYEKRSDLRCGNAEPGKSINLALSARGIAALERAGLARKILDSAIPMRGRMIHDETGQTTFQPYSKNPSEVINSVSRAQLNIDLLDAADQCPGVNLFFNRRCTDADLDKPSATLLDTNSKEVTHTSSDMLIGADGAFSAVRSRMQRLDRFDYRQDYLKHGYKELVIPPTANGGFAMEENALHIWPRRSYMMIALPNQDGSYTCTIFWPLDGPLSFDALKTDDDVKRFFDTNFPDATPHMPTLVDDYRTNPTGLLVTVRCTPWHYDDKVALIGDAAHAVVPFYGQGINAGFEDCDVLMDCIDEHAPNWGRVFSDYTSRRKENVDALADLAISNFVEMRDHVCSPAFLRKKKRERLLHRWLPGYTPLYSMISFSQIPYAEAVRSAADQDAKIRHITWTLGSTLVALLILTIWWMT
jgi:kynurenine 3-monooxygenase